MTNNQKFLIGAKYGALAIAASLFTSPLLYLLMIFLQQASDHTNVPFDTIGVPWEMYLGTGCVILTFFSIPYLAWGGILGLLIADRKTTSPGRLGMIVGLVSGMMGLLLMASLIWRAESYRTIDWPIVGIAEIWSVIVFLAIAYRLKKIFTDKDL